MESGTEVFLDARRAPGTELPHRFPGVYRFCRAHGIDPVREPIPVTPAAHYHMGGIAVDAEGRSSVPGLRAAGEVAWTGVHGANRLASNSLLEGLVYGQRAGAAVRAEFLGGAPGAEAPLPPSPAPPRSRRREASRPTPAPTRLRRPFCTACAPPRGRAWA
jgi:L-aspartate oxidase